MIESFPKGFIKTQKTKTQTQSTKSGLCCYNLSSPPRAPENWRVTTQTQLPAPAPAGTLPGGTLRWPGAALEQGARPLLAGPAAGWGLRPHTQGLWRTGSGRLPSSPDVNAEEPWGSGCHLDVRVQDIHIHPTGPFWVIAPKKILCLKKI